MLGENYGSMPGVVHSKERGRLVSYWLRMVGSGLLALYLLYSADKTGLAVRVVFQYTACSPNEPDPLLRCSAAIIPM